MHMSFISIQTKVGESDLVQLKETQTMLENCVMTRYVVIKFPVYTCKG